MLLFTRPEAAGDGVDVAEASCAWDCDCDCECAIMDWAGPDSNTLYLVFSSSSSSSYSSVCSLDVLLRLVVPGGRAWRWREDRSGEDDGGGPRGRDDGTRQRDDEGKEDWRQRASLHGRVECLAASRIGGRSSVMMMVKSEERDAERKAAAAKKPLRGRAGAGPGLVASQLPPGGNLSCFRPVFFLLSLRVRPDGVLFWGRRA